MRNEDRLAAEAIARVSGGLNQTIIQAQIRSRQELLALAQGGNLPTQPICPELTNANPSAPHTVLLEAMAWLLAQLGYRINQIPQQNLIEFARLHGIELKPTSAATTVLHFSSEAPVGTIITVPAGTQVQSADGQFVFETTQNLIIPSGALDGDVPAIRTVTGHTLLAPHTLTDLIDPVAFIFDVRNLSAIDSGTELESIESALERARQYQRRGERIVSTTDLEEAILEVLDGNGVVRAFSFVRNGDFAPLSREAIAVGCTTVIVMAKNGGALDDVTRAKISAVIDTVVGNQFIYVVEPFFVDFNVSVTVKLRTASPQGASVTAIENNLRAFYAADQENFGRPILRSEIIAVIEGTSGVDRIYSAPDAPILASPLTDLRLAEYQLPRLVSVTITVI